MVSEMVAFHLVEDNLRLHRAGQWNEVLCHESEDTVADVSELSFRLSRRALLNHRIPVTDQLSS